MVTKSFVVQKLEETPHLPHNEETIEMWLRVMVWPRLSFRTTAVHDSAGCLTLAQLPAQTCMKAAGAKGPL